MEEADLKALVKKVKEILRGTAIDTSQGLKLANCLIKADRFGWARRLLDILVERGISDTSLRKDVAQRRALATYKDPDINREIALNRALEILDTEFDLQKTQDHESLGLTGAIYKRKWEVGAKKLDLEASLQYYRRGYEEGVVGDDGYTAINAAFIQDILAHIEETQAQEAGGKSMTAARRREDAKKIREDVKDYLKDKFMTLGVENLSGDNYWQVVTLAEAFFGLHDHVEAKNWLAIARTIGSSEWQYFSTAKQLVHLTQMQTGIALTAHQIEDTEAWQTLIGFLGNNANALRTLFLGKLGLALSGGGFRASLYHIGVLANMAEKDLLRHVEVLSCVSGGSIVGAHYYLELRRMFLEKKPDAEIDRDDYVKIILNLVTDFVAGVQENPRVRVLANPWSNLKMIFSSSYSRTKRLGELYEKLIYSRVKDGEEDHDRWLNGLYIYPVENESHFVPRKDNWSRRSKIPELVLNATTLNTGHNWQFTASWMGESPVSIDADVDINDQYRRMYYEEAPEAFQKIRLGDAVGASSCVPGLFEPIIMENLYPDTTVRLVDGGVYDNQGVASLLEQDCNVIIASDATGQLSTDDDPGGGILKPLLRTNSTLMERVRGAQYQDLKARAQSSALKSFAYTHLKWGLDGDVVNWVGCEDPPKAPLSPSSTITPYGIRKDIQALLAGVRTDLDSFSDIESYALMTSGYYAAEVALQNIPDFPTNKENVEWKFLKVARGMQQLPNQENEYEKLKQHLTASSMLFFKVWKLYRPLTNVAKVMGVALVSSVGYAVYSYPDYKPFENWLTGLGQKLSLQHMGWTIVGMIVSYLAVAWLGPAAQIGQRLINFQDTFRRIAIGVGMGIVGWIGAWIHLHVFDRLFKKLGNVD